MSQAAHIARRSHSTRPRRRRGSGKRQSTRRTRIHWDRLGRIVLVIAILVVLASYIQPLSTYWSQRKAAQRSRADLTQLKQQRRDLRLRVKELNDPRMFETQARRLGMVREGERLFIIQGLER